MTLSNTIEKLVEEEVAKRIADIKTELSSTRSKLAKSQNEIYTLKEDIVKYKEIADNVESFNFLKSSVNEENFMNVIASFKVKKSDIEFSDRHMYHKETPLWMKAVIGFYPDKERVIGLMKYFDIKVPSWAGTFRMPYDFTKDEIEFIVNNIEENSISNGNYYTNNMGFYCDKMKEHQGNVKHKDRWNSRTSFPWQYLLKNKYFLEDDIFELVIDKIEKKKSNYEHFYSLASYQDLSMERKSRMMELLSKVDRWYDPQKTFVSNNGTLCLKYYPHLARSFKEKMSSDSRHTFYFGNFPLNMQAEFIERQNHGDKIMLIMNMKVEKEEKIRLMEKFNVL